jgi:hypothetical protein
MARTVIPVTRLSAKTGVFATGLPIDTLNLMQCRNTGQEVVVLVTGTGSSCTLLFNSVPDPYNRSVPIQVVQGASQIGYYGPFSPPQIWGDGAANMLIDPSAVSGTASIAVIAI